MKTDFYTWLRTIREREIAVEEAKIKALKDLPYKAIYIESPNNDSMYRTQKSVIFMDDLIDQINTNRKHLKHLKS